MFMIYNVWFLLILCSSDVCVNKTRLKYITILSRWFTSSRTSFWKRIKRNDAWIFKYSLRLKNVFTYKTVYHLLSWQTCENAPMPRSMHTAHTSRLPDRKPPASAPSAKLHILGFPESPHTHKDYTVKGSRHAASSNLSALTTAWAQCQA